ncbi:type II secretion system protein [Protaetiibacter larvae]|uniref:Prepilin-type N-terminal cleavage/methylation domain-containing protein n=1 Tax=Protaetiibacter larvae TaxID=2592654 RepID=A0A5C1Y5Q1_9MICO|nr:prepilin-type N-terminal cleavage/methylation domain-containing protein [Protaetiibacter larvae]QEO09224.1 prepilin-type N-terminal cleavage/methylation domain-containing protein [Protaetiibacter larvae]
MISAIHRTLIAKRDALKANEEKGFTLIELLVVVLIIGILAAIAVPVYLGIQDSARESAVKSDLAAVKTAIVAYIVQNDEVPDIDDLAVKIDDGNYSVTPAFALAPASATAPWRVSATASNGKFYAVTDADAPYEATDAAGATKK